MTTQRRQRAIMILLGVVVLFVGSCSNKGKEPVSGAKTDPIAKETRQAPEPKNDPAVRIFSAPTIEGRGVPQIACYLTEGMTLNAPIGPQVMILVWADGQLLYSQNQQHGGPPYFEAKIDEAQVKSFFSNLLAKGLWTDSRFCINFPPDSSYITLFLYQDDRVIELCSSHDGFEENKNLVQTYRGVQSLEGKSLAEVLAAQPAGYRYFRKIWDAIRTESKVLVPNEGKSVNPVFTWASVRVLCTWLEMNDDGTNQ